MGFHSLLMRLIICQKQQQQRKSITCRSIYKYYYSGLSSSSNPSIFRSSSIIPNFQIHTLSRIANPNPNLNRNIIFKRFWDDDDYLVSSKESAHTYYHVGVFSNSIGTDRIPIDDQVDTINSEIYHCCEDNQVIYGFSLLAGIIKLGLVPNRYTYCPLLVGLMFKSRFTEAISMFDMLITHREIQPDVLTYETIIQVCFDLGYDLDLYSFSIFLTHVRQVILYQPLVIKYCRRKQLWCKGLDRSDAYDTAYYYYLKRHVELDDSCKKKCFHEALSMIRSLEFYCVVVGIEVYNTVISHMVYAGEIDQAIDLFYRSVAELKLKPTAKTYAAIILGLSYKGLWDKALELLIDVYFSDYLPHDFKLACDNFFQERLPPYLDVPCLTHVSTDPYESKFIRDKIRTMLFKFREANPEKFALV